MKKATKKCIICNKLFEHLISVKNRVTCGDYECRKKLRVQRARNYNLKKKNGYKPKKRYIFDNLTYIKKNKYYCNKCKKVFFTKLPCSEAICTLCGSDNILE